MRQFHSYGPVDCEEHYCVERKTLVQQCTDQLIGHPEKGGHYFTIWAPRQTGKTWIINQSAKCLKSFYSDSFIVADLSMQQYEILQQSDPIESFFKIWKNAIYDKLDIDTGKIDDWNNWLNLFKKKSGLLTKKMILFIDEFDKLHNEVIDKVVSMFRHMYLSRNEYLLHGLSLVGVRAVMGIDSKKGSPFNVQRSVHIPNLTVDEVKQMFDDYQSESLQNIDPKVVQQIFETTNGQPGLIGWFGELLTKKYNETPQKSINMKLWKKVYKRSIHIEHNNTLQNLIIKAKNEYKNHVYELFKNSNIEFTFASDWCNYMYMHGIIAYTEVEKDDDITYTCRFSCPYVQDILYIVFVKDMESSHNKSILPLEPTDLLEDVFNIKTLNIPALLKRYKNFLNRLTEKGSNPWANQPRRKTDYHLTEAVGHFHLYFWLKLTLDDICTIIPEFPTGNGKVDLHIKCDQDKKGLIEVKSFVNPLKVKSAIIQAAEYAKQTNYSEITIAMFAPFTDEDVLNQISVSQTIGNVTVNVLAIGQG